MDQNIAAIIVATVEGLTEFLPISSTGHMIIVGNLIGFSGNVVSVFDVFIQFGAILSVLFLYPQRFIKFFTKDGWNYKKGFSVWHVMAGCIPCMTIAFFSYKYIKLYLFNPFTVAIGLFVGAILLWYGEIKAEKMSLVDNLDGITLKPAFKIGIFQILSLWPGFSRSGSTIAGGMLSGLSRGVSASFTFIMAVPIMCAASLYDLLKNYRLLDGNDLQLLILGFFMAAVVAYISMAWFVKFVQKHSLISFAWYRVFLACLTIWYFYR